MSNENKLTLPTDSQERKNYPLLRGCLRYFPAALAGVANTSQIGNDKHNLGQEMHHSRGKSWDHGDCILRHLIDTQDLLAAYERDGSVTIQQVLQEVNQMAWRALAYSQILHEQFGAPMAPGAKAENSEPTEGFDYQTGTETFIFKAPSNNYTITVPPGCTLVANDDGSYGVSYEDDRE